MKKLIFFMFLSFLLFLVPLFYADSTFFDNENDVFIMGNFQTTQTTQTTDSEIISGAMGGCRYEWNCTNWTECFSDGKQTRNCTNIGSCSDKYKTPQIEQNCIHIIKKEDEKSKELEKENVTWKDEEFPKEQGKEGQQRRSIIFQFIIISIGIILIGGIFYYFVKRLRKN